MDLRKCQGVSEELRKVLEEEEADGWMEDLMDGLSLGDVCLVEFGTWRIHENPRWLKLPDFWSHCVAGVLQLAPETPAEAPGA